MTLLYICQTLVILLRYLYLICFISNVQHAIVSFYKKINKKKCNALTLVFIGMQ